MDNKDIKKNIASFYKEVAENRDRVIEDKKSLSKSIGYREEDLEVIPEEANMGLGCGSPISAGEPQAGEVVVDLGCGKGMDVFLAAEKVGENGRVIGIDMTLEMLNEARKIAEENGYENTEFRLGEIEHLPVADNTADLVISNCVINLSIDKQQVYDDIYRILKKGGRISISDITLENPLPNEVLENPCMYGTWIAGALTLDKLKKILEKSGFKDISIDTKTVSPEYAKEWGFEIDIENYLDDHIRSSTLCAYKR